MSRIEKTFQELHRRREKALVGFVTAGDPDPARSESIVAAMCEAGVDLLELGVPFSDPTADGPVIQRSSSRALRSGMDMEKVMDMTRGLRAVTSVPVVLFSYYNPILAYGAERFYEDAVAAGADGVLVVDLPPEESDEMTGRWPGNALDLIRLVAPTTPPHRMEAIVRKASGFLYLVSMTGVTGRSGLDLEEVSAVAASLKAVTSLPVCVGFGISTPEQATAVTAMADGVVVGSAFERLIEAHMEDPQLPGIVARSVRSLKDALRAAPEGREG